MSFPQDIKFDVVHEGWNEYILSDKVTLRTRFLLIKVARIIDPQKGVNYNFNSQNFTAAFAAEDQKGVPTLKPMTPQDLEASITDEMDFETLNEDWNTYKLADGSTVNIKLVLTRVAKTNKFDPMGAPIYLTQTQTVIKPKIAPNLMKKVVQTSKSEPADKKGNLYTV